MFGSSFFYRIFSYRVSPFWLHLSYFISFALLGSLALMVLNPTDPSFTPRYIDILYLSTSALTVSGLATIEMEVLSSSQIAVLTILMLLGGEVFVSLMGLLSRKDRHRKAMSNNTVEDSFYNIELTTTPVNHQTEIGSEVTPVNYQNEIGTIDGKELKYNSIRYLGLLVLGYILVFHLGGTLITFIYVTHVSSARDVLTRKGIHKLLFSISVTVSAFANSGLMPTNENMVVFRENSGLLALMIVLIKAGNTLFPMVLSLVIWGLSNLLGGEEFELMMRNPRAIGFDHLRPSMETAMVSFTVIGFLVIQVIVFWSMDWNSGVFHGLDSVQKFVNGLFMAANTRHAGETTVDLSIVSPAVLVIFVVMMYLPSSTSFRPFKEKDNEKVTEGRLHRMQDIILSQLPCVIIFVISICMTERKKLSTDPLNFSIFNIVFEVISAYSNVGLSMGYSCERKSRPTGICENKSYGFSGWWTNEGKLILCFVMLYGRLKKFTVGNGKAWTL